MSYALGSSSITWTWNPVVNATSYNVYLATSPSTLVASVSVSSDTEIGLAINTLYGRTVTAVVGGLEGPLCDAASSYTLTLPPGAPTFTDIAFTSATVSWSANGNPDGTPYEYTKAFSFGYGGIVYNYDGNFTSTTTFVSGLAEGCSFYFSVVSRNSAGVRSASAHLNSLDAGDFLSLEIFTGTATGSEVVLNAHVPLTVLGCTFGRK